MEAIEAVAQVTELARANKAMPKVTGQHAGVNTAMPKVTGRAGVDERAPKVRSGRRAGTREFRNCWRARPAALAAAATLIATASVVALPTTTAWADGGQCTFSSKNYAGRPWSLQRVNLDELWALSTGENVQVAVIDTGVDVKNRQLTQAVDASKGANYLPAENLKGEKIDRGNDQGTTDTVGHGTRVAGIIAARPLKGTGFVGLAPDAEIIPVKQNNAEGDGTALTLASSIRYAVDEGADVINISQDTANAVKPDARLEAAVDHALVNDVVVVASAGNDGLGGNVKVTYPASYKGVLAVAASDRNNERASFSQSGDFVGVAAPGVDMISTVPGGGHCSDNGTSFSAPYVAGVAALLKSKYPTWSAQQIVAQIEQTAERSIPGHDPLVGWGVVDPVKALTDVDPEHPVESPKPEDGVTKGEAPAVTPLRFGETAEERNTRLATYVVVGGLVLVAGLGGTAVAVRDGRRRQRRLGRLGGDAWTR
ncbi:type VII secretion-associated serine protease mycosin [Streptomyces europaeiscabiei]|uniref:type VII secretion-associated serine protease mycosin n=1 Tax=Streptomyces europaeiscabiei TaxID=146819 RepID=UPI0029B07487|nr:type VII secretion-associated serine protease mycosin [Streptomyces europaeiscabiei]MDX3714328.1 type VII secretion-associated serine protease mycosin [Streptomyces europaeiscabiei]MDX3865546.1 type VII secretion-associated serine protease mycosin [Streptomyces europaeiscabiei]MDX3875005.1 type VII secretion-associated serine protease mycosin [Streptomyces europaeiscabiei]